MSYTAESDDDGMHSPAGDSIGYGCKSRGKGSVLKKGPWTSTEDGILINYVRKHGEGNWNAVQKYTSLARCGKSCRLRWANHLRPNLKKGAFSQEEERLIVQMHAKMGNKWAQMAEHVSSIVKTKRIFCGCYLIMVFISFINPFSLLPVAWSNR